MKPPSLNLNWFDILVVVVILLGVVRGRKRGISEELLDILQWLLIVVLAALFYMPLGNLVASYTHLSLLPAYVACYLSIAIAIKLLFTAIKSMVGEKLIQADTFGGMEYYLGMLAGALRFLCVLIVALALLNSKYISKAEREALKRMQSDNFGSISFPTLSSLQETVFGESISGKFIRVHLKDQLIRPTPATANVGSQLPRDRDLDEVLGNK
ncbi:MAG: Colicin production protein [Verrucomicrobiales bacterium]|jgi:uncharacterized membrane protein required for colicin V production|nr:Colicin production protein [Verrucomicrobiales bacterium]